VTDAERSGRPATATQNEERARRLILQNRRMTVEEIALGLPVLWCMKTFSSLECVPKELRMNVSACA
jgi:hypothetical protein